MAPQARLGLIPEHRSPQPVAALRATVPESDDIMVGGPLSEPEFGAGFSVG